jgi:hypothetical protein
MSIEEKINKHLISLKNRLEKYHYKDSKSGCWIWTGCFSGPGVFSYGRLMGKLKENQKKATLLVASRVSYLLNVGEIPKGYFILHSCDNPKCINPDHLRAGTQLENMHDCINRGRKNYLYGKEHHAAKLTDSQVKQICNKRVWRWGDISKMARNFNVSKTTISRAKNRISYK